MMTLTPQNPRDTQDAEVLTLEATLRKKAGTSEFRTNILDTVMGCVGEYRLMTLRTLASLWNPNNARNADGTTVQS